MPDIRGSQLLGFFAVPLGLAGLGGLWQALRATEGVPAWPAEVLYAASTILWAALLVAYVAGGARDLRSFRSDRQHAIHGPFAAFIPVVGILLSSHYVLYLPDAARFLVAAFVVALAVLVAQLLSYWLLGNLPLATFHPGYFLPMVAGAFIASIGLSLSGWHAPAEAAFGIGVFFWVAIGTLVFGRLFTGSPLPDPMKPTLAVLVSAPATAGVAWMVLVGGIDVVGYVLLGVLFMMLLVQLMLVPTYRTLSFTPNFWTFTFPVAASANFVVRWLATISSDYRSAFTWLVAALATAFVAAIAARTAVYVAGVRRAPVAGPVTPSQADSAVLHVVG